MKPTEQENPFESPTAASDPGIREETILRHAALAWQLPLIGLGMCPILFLLSAIMIPTSLVWLVSLAIVAFFLGGFAMTLYDLLIVRSYPNVLPHFIGGIAVFYWVILFMCGGLSLVWLLIDASPNQPPPPVMIPVEAQP